MKLEAAPGFEPGNKVLRPRRGLSRRRLAAARVEACSPLPRLWLRRVATSRGACRVVRRLRLLGARGGLGLGRTRARFPQLRDARSLALPRLALLLRALQALALLLRLEE